MSSSAHSGSSSSGGSMGGYGRPDQIIPAQTDQDGSPLSQASTDSLNPPDPVGTPPAYVPAIDQPAIPPHPTPPPIYSAPTPPPAYSAPSSAGSIDQENSEAAPSPRSGDETALPQVPIEQSATASQPDHQHQRVQEGSEAASSRRSSDERDTSQEPTAIHPAGQPGPSGASAQSAPITNRKKRRLVPRKRRLTAYERFLSEEVRRLARKGTQGRERMRQAQKRWRELKQEQGRR